MHTSRMSETRYRIALNKPGAHRAAQHRHATDVLYLVDFDNRWQAQSFPV